MASEIPTTFRKNPMTGETILIQPGRGGRPWQGLELPTGENTLPKHQPGCYLCPGERRTSGIINPPFETTYVFPNDSQPFIAGQSPETDNKSLLSFAQEEVCDGGQAEVVVYSPDHGRNMNNMRVPEISNIVRAWQEQYVRMGNDKNTQYVLQFENRRKESYSSLPHSHGQAYGYPFIPDVPANELRHLKKYFKKMGRGFFEDYLRDEASEKVRIVAENKSFVWLMPYWAVWPAETMIIPKQHLASIDKMNDQQIADLSEIFQILTKVYAVAFMCPKNGAPYTMIIHQAPTDGKKYNYQDMHFHFHPPQRDPYTLKGFVGAEQGAIRGRDSSVEVWAAFLRGIYERISERGLDSANLEELSALYYQVDAGNIFKNPEITFPF